MLKRINWKSVFKCFAWVFCLAGLVVLMSFVDAKKKTVLCTNVKILIPGADNFIEREEIDAILKQSQGSLIGQKLTGINLQRIEKNIIANPYIAYATVFADMNGVIQIQVKQRQPVLRMINLAGQDYYIDSNGLKMPVSPNFTANVLAANGNIMEHFSGKVDTLITKLAVDLYKVAMYVKQDTLWDAQVEQLYVNDVKDIEMIPRLGNQRIILGTADSLETKMRNLRAFYKKALPKVGWNTYKTINVKYTNQIVCEKNKIDSLTGEVIKDRVASSAKPIKKAIDSATNNQVAAEKPQANSDKKEKVKTDTRKNN
uniref:cell division protein FtsQ/DivIB n=1 Tax=Pedobacter schmidteae TaxID=2201271 RepID=UPI000EAF6ECA|nr:cell division protein FtsQ [Pedobacter schmidteae]